MIPGQRTISRQHEDPSIVVLHVDDDPRFVELCAEMLKREDERFVPRSETHPADALDTLATETVNCIVSDYEMPSRNGIELLETVRERDGELPFILFTGKGSESVASDAISAGVSDYVVRLKTSMIFIEAPIIRTRVSGTAGIRGVLSQRAQE